MLGDIAAVEEKAVCREENEDGLVPGNIAEDGANASELAMKTINKTTAIMICCERPIFDMILTVTPPPLLYMYIRRPSKSHTSHQTTQTSAVTRV